MNSNMNHFRRLTDRDLEAKAERLERTLDRLADGYWPAAGRQRAEALELLTRLRAEAERRRA